MEKIPFFENLTWWQIQQVSELLYERNYERDEYLFEVEQPGAALFLIESGRVSIEVKGENHQLVVLAEIEAGAFLGELALLDQSPRSASARAIQSTRALALFRNDLDRLMEREPGITSHIFKALALVIGDRLKATNELIKSEAA